MHRAHCKRKLDEPDEDQLIGTARTSADANALPDSVGSEASKKISIKLATFTGQSSSKIAKQAKLVGKEAASCAVSSNAKETPKPPISSASADRAQHLVKNSRVAKVFAEDSDSEHEEEVPEMARMRMKNIGRDTPTSSGPNSFLKGKHGFQDRRKQFDKLIGKLSDTD